MLDANDEVTFSSVSQISGVSRKFLYNNEEIRNLIGKYSSIIRVTKKKSPDKTSKSKDIIIATKNKRIKELTEENRKQKLQIEILNSKIYNQV